MRSISLKIEERTLQETDSLVPRLAISRNRYINDAVAHYNKLQRDKLVEAQLIKESKIVSENSLEVLREFEELGDEL